MRGFYFCGKCNLFIEVLTYSYTPEGMIKAKIYSCPHCMGRITEISKKEFNSVIPVFQGVFYRSYRYKHVGKRKIGLLLKWC